MKDGGSAFPIINEFESADGVSRIEAGAPGMSLRDWFAGQALVGLMESTLGSISEKVRTAYEVADAMLERREIKT